MKQCTWCKEIKKNSEFYTHKKTNRTGLYCHCKQCCSEKRKRIRREQPEIIKRYWSSQKEKMRWYRIKKLYNLTQKDYETILEKQNYSCAICLRHKDLFPKYLSVDHDHKTGEVFGLLCTFCNHRIIGRQRNADQYQRAADYLRQGTGIFVPIKSKPKKRKVK